LAAAVIGGYLGLLPLLSSLAAGPAWPDPIASRSAAPAVTLPTQLSNDAPSGETEAPAPDAGNEPVRNDVTPAETEGGAETVADAPKAQKSEVTVVVSGGLERVTKPKPAIQVTPRTNGGSGGGSSSGGSSGGGGSSAGGGSNAGGGSSGGGTVTPPSPPALDDYGPGDVAGDTPDNGDDAPTAGP
jgi:uncharacterized membrane protein YgcG